MRVFQVLPFDDALLIKIVGFIIEGIGLHDMLYDRALLRSSRYLFNYYLFISRVLILISMHRWSRLPGWARSDDADFSGADCRDWGLRFFDLEGER